MRECMGNNKTIYATGHTSATSASESASASAPGAAAATAGMVGGRYGAKWHKGCARQAICICTPQAKGKR